MYSDARFMSAADKERLVKAWRTFVRHGLKREHFTDRVYKHLSLHCGHIAHFNRDGFYATWFERGDDRVRFIDHFLAYRVLPDYEDVHAAMTEILRQHEQELRACALEALVARLRDARAAIDARLAELGVAA